MKGCGDAECIAASIGHFEGSMAQRGVMERTRLRAGSRVNVGTERK